MKYRPDDIIEWVDPHPSGGTCYCTATAEQIAKFYRPVLLKLVKGSKKKTDNVLHMTDDEVVDEFTTIYWAVKRKPDAVSKLQDQVHHLREALRESEDGFEWEIAKILTQLPTIDLFEKFSAKMKKQISLARYFSYVKGKE